MRPSYLVSTEGYINSRFRYGPEQDPVALDDNEGCAFMGANFPIRKVFDLSDGQELPPEGYPYIGGKEVNTNPTQDFHRYTYYHLTFSRPGLAEAIGTLPRCLVNSQVTKHLVFAFQPTDRVFGNTLYVYPLPAYTHFAVLQSRVHAPWARLLSSLEDRLRYAASDCFVNFPFPDPNPRTIVPELEEIGNLLYSVRAVYMTETKQGLTKTYNALKDPCVEDGLVFLRNIHVEMDKAVLTAYGWSDLAESAPPYTETDTEWEDEIVDRLMVLNHERAKRNKRK